MGQKQDVCLIQVSKRRFCARRSNRRRAAGFSLVELMVVVGIIILLLGIGLVAGTKFIAEGKKEQTKAMLDGLLGANTEYIAKRKSSVNHDGKTPVDWSKVKNGGALSSCERFVYACSQIEAVAVQLNAALTSSGQKSMDRIYYDSTSSDPDSVKEIYDTWGTQVEYRSFNNGEGRGPVTNVPNDKLPLSKSPFFVSAGPDKMFGTEDDIMTIDNPAYKD
jgi:Tfp pilus assembly protein PilE